LCTVLSPLGRNLVCISILSTIDKDKYFQVKSHDKYCQYINRFNQLNADSLKFVKLKDTKIPALWKHCSILLSLSSSEFSWNQVCPVTHARDFLWTGHLAHSRPATLDPFVLKDHMDHMLGVELFTYTRFLSAFFSYLFFNLTTLFYHRTQFWNYSGNHYKQESQTLAVSNGMRVHTYMYINVSVSNFCIFQKMW
jgi:hypothetical protein